MQKALVLQSGFDSLKGQFCLFTYDNRIWRCGGRLQKTDLPFTTEHPILLPQKHTFTTLVVCDTHLRVDDNGVKETLTEMRRKYWVVYKRSEPYHSHNTQIYHLQET